MLLNEFEFFINIQKPRSVDLLSGMKNYSRKSTRNAPEPFQRVFHYKEAKSHQANAAFRKSHPWWPNTV